MKIVKNEFFTAKKVFIKSNSRSGKMKRKLLLKHDQNFLNSSLHPKKSCYPIGFPEIFPPPLRAFAIRIPEKPEVAKSLELISKITVQFCSRYLFLTLCLENDVGRIFQYNLD